MNPCMRSLQNFIDDPAVDVGEAEVAAGPAVGESLVVEAHQVQDHTSPTRSGFEKGWPAGYHEMTAVSFPQLSAATLPR